MKRYLLTVLATLLTGSFVSATTSLVGLPILEDSVQISVLTCSPGEAIYELFGHTGLRIYDANSGVDVVANYGLFDFDQPNFIGRFVRGKTDYTVGIWSTDYFIESYKRRGSGVQECVLNLSNEEKAAIIHRLDVNLKPENKIYRYNFIFNNCATKIRDIIEISLNEKIQYPTQVEQYSFREAVGLYTTKASWAQFGFDLCLGAGMDQMASPRELLFLPEFLGDTYAASTLINDNGQVSKFCAANKCLVPHVREDKSVWISPTIAAYALLVVILVVSFFEYRQKKSWKWIDVTLFTMDGILGCVIAFLFFFSEHPFTGHNFNILWMNPLMLWPLIAACIPFLRKLNGVFYFGASAILLVFMAIMPIVSQCFNPTILPLALVFLVRSLLRARECRNNFIERHSH